MLTAAKNGKAALLLIDIQQCLVDGPEELYQAEVVIGRCADLLHRARAAGMPVLHVQHNDGPGSDLERLSPGWQHHPAVKPSTGEPVFEKMTPSAFVSGNLDRYLHAAGITKLIIAGLQTDYCVDTNCRVARNLGYDVILVSDAHSTFDGPDVTAAQIIAHHNRILSSSTVVLQKAADILF